MDLQGVRVAVLGGTSGIGRATAALLADQGADVVVAGRSEDKVAQTVAALPAVRGEQVDATDRGQLDALFDRLGEIDHLVVCVSGGFGAGPFAALDLTVLRRAFAAKTFAQLEAVQAALSHLTRAGSVTLVTAASAQAASPGTAGLAAVNGALEAAVPPLAAELAPLRVNAVSPGVIDTPWWNSWPDADRAAFFAQASQRLPTGRTGHPDDIAAAVALLIGNGFITGHVLVVDGGAHLAR